jgi:protein PhnA
MSRRELNKRSESKCELCAATENLKVYEVLPTKKVELTKL